VIFGDGGTPSSQIKPQKPKRAILLVPLAGAIQEKPKAGGPIWARFMPKHAMQGRFGMVRMPVPDDQT
jgi:hypothetical protein